jgi:hypothetical protein
LERANNRKQQALMVYSQINGVSEEWEMAFYGVYVEDDDRQEYRLGFEAGAGQYQPSFELRDGNGQWNPIERICSGHDMS